MSGPKLGDVLIRRQESVYVIADAITGKHLETVQASLREATLTAVRLSNGGGVWQDNVDKRGRPLGPPVLLPIRLCGGGEPSGVLVSPASSPQIVASASARFLLFDRHASRRARRSH